MNTSFIETGDYVTFQGGGIHFFSKKALRKRSCVLPQLVIDLRLDFGVTVHFTFDLFQLCRFPKVLRCASLSLSTLSHLLLNTVENSVLTFWRCELSLLPCTSSNCSKCLEGAGLVQRPGL